MDAPPGPSPPFAIAVELEDGSELLFEEVRGFALNQAVLQLDLADGSRTFVPRPVSLNVQSQAAVAAEAN